MQNFSCNRKVLTCAISNLTYVKDVSSSSSAAPLSVHAINLLFKHLFFVALISTIVYLVFASF